MKTNNFKTVRAYNINWLKNATNNDTGAQQMVINSKQDNNIVIKSFTNKFGHIFSDVKPSEFIEASKFNFNLMEIINNNVHKVYFDIDAKTETIKDKTNYRAFCISEIEKIFPASDMALSGSENEYKYSYHITLNNYNVNNDDDKALLKIIVKKLKETISDIDITVYSKNRCMKFINQSKPTTKLQPLKRIQEIILNDDITKHCITSFLNLNAVSISEMVFNNELKLYLDIEDKNKPFNITTLPKIKRAINNTHYNNIVNEFDENEILTPIKLLTLAPLDANFKHNYTFFVLLFCFSNNLTINNFLEWYNQKTTDNIKHQYKINLWASLDKYKGVSSEAFINMLSNYYPKIKTDKHKIRMDKLFDISKYKEYIQIIDEIRPNNFISVLKYNEQQEHDEQNKTRQKNLLDTIYTNNITFEPYNKYTIFNVGMGGGKTTQTINYLKKMTTQNPNLKFLFITPNITLSRSLYTRLKNEQINIEHYDEEYTAKKTKNKKQKNEMRDAGNLITCLNSLHYLKNNIYDIIICDEIETLLHKWYANETLMKKPIDSMEGWDIFINLFDKAKQVILLDAFTTNLSLDFIKSLDGNTTLKIYQKLKETSEKVIKVIKNKNEWLKGIISKLNKGFKVWVYYPYNKGNLKNESMETIKKTIETATNKKGISYNADCDDKNIKDLDDVANTWGNIDFVLTNSKITVGINYEESDFNCVFLAMAGFSSGRDVIQASCRCRYITSNYIYLHFIDNYNNVSTFDPNDKLMYKNNIYDALATNIIIEKLAPLKGTFYNFCKMAGYKLEINSEMFNDDINTDINELLNNNTISINYDNIDSIDNYKANKLQYKIIQHQATTEDKLKLKKYFFNKLFIENDNNDNIINIMFDDNYFKFIDALNNIIPNKFEKNIFEMIKELNKWACIFPTNEELKKVILDDNILDMLFNDDSSWTFKKLNRKSGAKILIKDIYYKTFGREIIKTKTDKNKNATYTINNNIHDVYNYCIENLIKYNEDRENKLDVFEDDNINNVKLNLVDDIFED